MPLSSKVRERCRKFLEPGEQIQYLIPGTTLYNTGAPLRTAAMVMVTDRHVTLLACSRWRTNWPKGVWEQLPRKTEIGPLEVHPSLGPMLTVGKVTLEIDEEYVSAIRAANLEGAGGELPEDPHPAL